MNKLFKDPSPIFLIVIYSLTLACSVISVIFAVKGSMGALAYGIFAISACLLGYSVYTVVLFHKKIKAFFLWAVSKSAFAKKYMSSSDFRTLVGSAVSFSFGVILGIVNGALGIIDNSVWFGALSAYYILTALIYGVLLLNLKASSYKIYRRCGFFMAFLNVALSVAIAQMIFESKAFKHGEIMVFVFATYAFYKLTMAIIRLVKSRREECPAMRAVALVNLTCGAVSILALQTTLLSAFAQGVNISLFNTLTGTAVSLFAMGISIFMIINGTKKINLEKKHEQQ